MFVFIEYTIRRTWSYGIVGYVSYYSIWSKRHTTWNTVIGSFPGAVPPLIGWVAIEGQISLTAIALFLVVFCWQPIHFMP